MRFLVGGLLLLSACLGFGASSMTMDVNIADGTFSVQLPANPTTGFQWTLVKIDKSLLKMTNKQYLAPSTKLIGAGGTTTFTFSILPNKVYPAQTQLTFEYARPWDQTGSTTKQVFVRLNK